MTKIDLITGFLGSGKTTLLKKYLNYLIQTGENVCVLEFDYGAVNIDMMLLQEFNDKCDLEMISGGCDYDCHQRRFKTKLISIGMKHYDRVIIEPSGIFNPIELFDILNEEPLNDWYEIGSIISVVDSLNLTSLASYKDLLKSQLSYSSLIYLRKSQKLTPNEFEKIEQIVLKYSDFTDKNKIITKCIDDFDDEDFSKIKIASYREPIAHLNCIDFKKIFKTMYFLDSHFTLSQLISFSASLFKSNLYGNVLRIKGFISEGNKWYELNRTRNEYTTSEVNNGQNVIIVIGENLNEKEINGLFF